MMTACVTEIFLLSQRLISRMNVIATSLYVYIDPLIMYRVSIFLLGYQI